MVSVKVTRVRFDSSLLPFAFLPLPYCLIGFDFRKHYGIGQQISADDRRFFAVR